MEPQEAAKKRIENSFNTPTQREKRIGVVNGETIHVYVYKTRIGDVEVYVGTNPVAVIDVFRGGETRPRRLRDL